MFKSQDSDALNLKYLKPGFKLGPDSRENSPSRKIREKLQSDREKL